MIRVSRRAFFLLVSLVLLATLAGCRGGVGALTPEQAVRNAVEQIDGPEAAAAMQVLGTRPGPQGTLVLYTGISPARGQRPAMRTFGYFYVVFDLRAGGWMTRNGGSGGSDRELPAGTLIDFGAGSGGGGEEWLSLVYGRTLSPQVAAVEATFDNGQRLRDTTSGGVFAVAVAEKADWCELRVLGADGQVLETKKSSQIAAAKLAAGEPPSKCPQ